MAVSEGHVARNPAELLFIPREAARPEHTAMSREEVQKCFSVLDQRERLVVKFAVLAGLRPGEIFGLKWGHLSETHVEVRQRVYRGEIDTPKTSNSIRKAALSAGLMAEIELWRSVSLRRRCRRLGVPVRIWDDPAWTRQRLAAANRATAEECKFRLGGFSRHAAHALDAHE